MKAELTDRVREWIGADGTVSIELPGRWFGRPMDNRHSLTWAVSTEGRAVLEFDGQFALWVVGTTSFTIDEEVATISAEHIVFDWQEYGSSGAYRTEIYDDGFVRLHRH